MQSTNLLIITVLITLTLLVGSSTSATPAANSNFIKASCKATPYPELCVKSLSVYENAIQQSPRKLAQKALSVSLIRARSASSFVSKLSRANGIKARDLAAVEDCVDNIGDGTDRLTQSIRELGQVVGRPDSQTFRWRISNVQTWASAALTDLTTCTDGLARPGISSNVKSAIRGRIAIVSQVTSNALALVNRFANGTA
ncbi:hypothetical protein ACLOJK_033432 [Asimina triloba]